MQPKRNRKVFYLFVKHNGDGRLFEDHNLLNIQHQKHNYKSSPHFKGAFISPIFDSDTKQLPAFLTSDIKWPLKRGK